MTPGQRSKQRWVAGLAELEPDLVVDTGDNLAHTRAVPAVLAALDPLLSLPGALRLGQQRLLRPHLQEPRSLPASRPGRSACTAGSCPGATCAAALIERGWQDAHAHPRRRLDVAGVRDRVRRRRRPAPQARPLRPVAGARRRRRRRCARADPLPRAARARRGSPPTATTSSWPATPTAASCACPVYGALVTNCGIDRSRARGCTVALGHAHAPARLRRAWAPPRTPPSASPARRRRRC